MKIALLTIWHEKNYGAELQAYATIKVLQQLGHDVKMIDIRLSDMGKPSIAGRIALLLEYFSPCNRKFNKFWKRHIPTTRRYHSIEELQSNPPIADMYIVGSDQVWNPDITKKFTKLFFLDFGGKHIKRVSYASSFGTDKWYHNDINPEIKDLLNRFDLITCREETGVDILRNLFDVDATLVLDPTMLLDDYSELTGVITPRRTLVYYPLNDDPELAACAHRIANELNLELINNKQCTGYKNKIIWDRVSIESWIKNIAESSFVITRSFHGIIFSILYNRQFAVIVGNKKVSTRVTCLLRILNLEDRLFETPEELFDARPWENYINYEIVDESLQQYKKQSLAYLNF